MKKNILHTKKLKQSIDLIIFCFISVFLLIVVFQSLLWFWGGLTISRHSENLLIHSENVANHQLTAINEAERGQSSVCSDEDLILLRKITFQYLFVKDAGRIIDGNIICSALWGKLDKPYPLKNGRVNKLGYILWDGIENFKISSMLIDIASKSNSFVVTSPDAFAAYEHVNDNVNLVVTSHSTGKVLHVFGSREREGDQVSHSCSGHFDFCVEAKMNNIILSKEYIIYIYIACIIGSIFGFVFWLACNEKALRRKTIGNKLIDAMKNENLSVVYKPILYTDGEKFFGFEMIPRWYDNELGNISPLVFFNEAKKLHINNILNKIFIKKSLCEFKPLLIKEDVFLSISIDKELVTDELFFDFFVKCLNECNIPHKKIAIEISDGLEISSSQTSKLVSKLKNIGFTVFIGKLVSFSDDISILKYIGFNKLKIDNPLSQSLGTESCIEFPLTNIIEQLRTLDIGVIFNEINHIHQKEMISGHFPNVLVQGGVYSKDMSINDIVNFFNHRL